MVNLRDIGVEAEEENWNPGVPLSTPYHWANEAVGGGGEGKGSRQLCVFRLTVFTGERENYVSVLDLLLCLSNVRSILNLFEKHLC